ncbi:MAG: DUF4398 domain-containing protein [Mariprofundus sp.]|nr:DUF4398 domain-containing protein [Mariprofundus sp.]
MQSVKRALFFMLIMLTSCALKPPVQEMSDARSAIKAAHELPGQQSRADNYLKSAEKSLDEAAEAIRAERYDMALSKAREAKRNAQEAARIKQGTHPEKSRSH